MKDRVISILGNKWKIKYKKRSVDECLDDSDGYCDETTKKIVIAIQEKEKYSCEDLQKYMRKVLRHEIIHSYLFECGLNECIPISSGQSELYVDWFARKFPDIYKTYKRLDILD